MKMSRRARNRRINEMRAVLKMAVKNWVHKGAHKEKIVTDFWEKADATRVYWLPTCLCRLCVIRLAKEKFNVEI